MPSERLRKLRRRAGRDEWAPLAYGLKKAIVYNPAIAAPGYLNGCRWLENINGSGASLRVRDPGAILHLRHTGWFVDTYGEDLTKPLVVQLPARGGVPRYYPACSDPWNDGSALVDFSDPRDCERDCALAADSLAERYAEECREDNARQRAEHYLHDFSCEIQELREEHSAACRAGLIDTARRLRKMARRCVAEIRALRADPWHAVAD